MFHIYNYRFVAQQQTREGEFHAKFEGRRSLVRREHDTLCTVHIEVSAKWSKLNKNRFTSVTCEHILNLLLAVCFNICNRLWHFLWKMSKLNYLKHSATPGKNGIKAVHFADIVEL